MTASAGYSVGYREGNWVEYWPGGVTIMNETAIALGQDVWLIVEPDVCAGAPLSRDVHGG